MSKSHWHGSHVTWLKFRACFQEFDLLTDALKVMKTLKEERPPPKCLASFGVFSPFGMAKKKKVHCLGKNYGAQQKGEKKKCEMRKRNKIAKHLGKWSCDCEPGRIFRSRASQNLLLLVQNYKFTAGVCTKININKKSTEMPELASWNGLTNLTLSGRGKRKAPVKSRQNSWHNTVCFSPRDVPKVLFIVDTILKIPEKGLPLDLLLSCALYAWRTIFIC